MLLSFFQRLGRPFRTMRPGRLIVLVFLFIILLGAGLLCLPAASRSGEPTPFLTSLFTATSATCVTGLIRVDTGTHWAMFGQVVILLLIQIGGLGFMTIACLFFFALRRKIGLRERMVLAQALGSDSYSGIVSLVRNILRGTAAVEGAGALILFFRFLPEFGFGKALWYGVFHSISAFCNAGFDVLADTDAGGSLCRYATDPVVNFTIMALIIIGGLGFAVWGDIRHNRRFFRMSVYTRLVILITTALIFGGAGIFAALEWNNPGTLAEADGGAVPVGHAPHGGLCDFRPERAVRRIKGCGRFSDACRRLVRLNGGRREDRDGRRDSACRVVDRARQDKRADHEAPDPAAGRCERVRAVHSGAAAVRPRRGVFEHRGSCQSGKRAV